MARRKTIDRNVILDAAEQVILESGHRGFTLDSVAARCGISKGGLVYTFASKDELIAATLERETGRFQESVQERLGYVDASDRNVLLAYINACLDAGENSTKIAALLIAAISQSSSFPDHVRQFYETMLARFRSSDADRDARQAFLAIEGAFLMYGLNLVRFSYEDLHSILVHARDTIQRGEQ